MTQLTLPDGRALEVQVHGADGAPLVLVHHGTPGSAALPAAYRAAADDLGLRLAGFARPGYGGSTRHAGRRVADVVPDALAVIDALGAERFATTGGSGGGPHALALGALAADRCVAVATVASAAPWTDADPDWDPLAGMGEGNLVEFAATIEGEAALRPLLDGERTELRDGGEAGLLRVLASVLSPPDLAVLDGGLAAQMFASMSDGLAPGVDGWLDDDLAFVQPWGFAPADVRVPVQLWQGDQDLMVPPAHARMLAARLPHVTPHLLPDDGHLTLHVTRARELLSPLAEALR